MNPKASPSIHVSVPPPVAGPSVTRPPVVAGLTSPWAETWKKQGTVAPGSWLPVPASFEQADSRNGDSHDSAMTRSTAEIPQEQNYETEADRQFFEKIRSAHNFGDGEDLNNAPHSLFQPSKLREPPIEHALVQQLLSTHDADNLLSRYQHMSNSYPFVIVPPSMSAHELYGEKPMLFLAIMTAASSHDHTQQMSLDVIFRRELAERTIITPKRTLGLVQSVLVYLSWYAWPSDTKCKADRSRYHFVFSHKTQQIFFLHHLVIGLALDIGLHRDYQPLNFPHRPKPKAPSPHDQRERERAFLGCYYLSSMCGIS